MFATGGRRTGTGAQCGRGTCLSRSRAPPRDRLAEPPQRAPSPPPARRVPAGCERCAPGARPTPRTCRASCRSVSARSFSATSASLRRNFSWKRRTGLVRRLPAPSERARPRWARLGTTPLALHCPVARPSARSPLGACADQVSGLAMAGGAQKGWWRRPMQRARAAVDMQGGRAGALASRAAGADLQERADERRVSPLHRPLRRVAVRHRRVVHRRQRRGGRRPLAREHGAAAEDLVLEHGEPALLLLEQRHLHTARELVRHARARAPERTRARCARCAARRGG